MKKLGLRSNAVRCITKLGFAQKTLRMFRSRWSLTFTPIRNGVAS